MADLEREQTTRLLNRLGRGDVAAESELLDSKVSVVLARREQVISRYQLIASVGKLTSVYLNLGVVQYDPTLNYDRVRDKLFGGDIDESE